MFMVDMQLTLLGHVENPFISVIFPLICIFMQWCLMQWLLIPYLTLTFYYNIYSF